VLKNLLIKKPKLFAGERSRSSGRKQVSSGCTNLKRESHVTTFTFKKKKKNKVCPDSTSTDNKLRSDGKDSQPAKSFCIINWKIINCFVFGLGKLWKH